jgi:cation:H+ antiporter
VKIQIAPALIGVAAIAGGAVAAVFATGRVGETLGIPELVAGLFIVGLLCALPESVAAWPLARGGQATIAASTALGDGFTSLTLAFIPLALVSTELGDVPLYAINLGAILVFVGLYAALNRQPPREHLTGRDVVLYVIGYGVYLAAVAWALL